MKGLGSRIKALRRERRLTLVDIAKKTSIDQATLSRIENEKMTGTLDSHMRIAGALGLRLPELYEAVTKKLEESSDKAAKHKLETFSHSSGAVAELLTTGVLQKKMMPVLLKIRAHGKTENEEYPLASERFLYVIKGSIKVRLDKNEILLKQGQNLYFQASTPHSFKNQHKTESWVLSVLTPASL